MCPGIAAQKKAYMFRIYSTLPLCGRKVSSCIVLCQENIFDMSEKTDGWPGPVGKVIGNDSQHLSDGIHELGGHALGSTRMTRGGAVSCIMR